MNGGAHWQCPNTMTQDATLCRAEAALVGEGRLQEWYGELVGRDIRWCLGPQEVVHLPYSPGSRGVSMKNCLGSKPSNWQNCWVWVSELQGIIDTTSPAA